MMEDNYKKTYKPLLVWTIGFLIIVTLPSIFLNRCSEKIVVSVTLGLTVLALYLLIFIIYHGGYVYWINGGPTFKEAKEAGSEIRRIYAKAHLNLFVRMIFQSIFYISLSLVCSFPIWLDVISVCLIILRATIQTMSIKFNH